MTTPYSGSKKNSHSRTIIATLLFGIGVNVSAQTTTQPVSPDEAKGVGLSAWETIKYDSNVFRLPEGGNTASTSSAGQHDDFISTTAAQLRYDQILGIHRLSMSFTPYLVRYLEFDQFDYFGNIGIVDWSGIVGSDGKYGIKYDHRREATSLTDQVSTERNLVTTDALQGDLVLRTGSQWQGVAGLRGSRSRNSADPEKGGDNHGWSADAGVRFAPSSGNHADVRYRRSDYDYPNVIPSQAADNSYVQNEIEFAWDWRLSVPSQLQGRISYLKREHEHFHERDFSGPVGNFKYIWRPTVATTVNANVYKDIGAITDASASYARTYGVSVVPEWDYSAQWRFGALAEWRHRRYEGYSLVGRPDERTTLAGASASYRPMRNWLFKLALNHERRHSSDSSRSYTDWVGALTARWDMQ